MENLGQNVIDKIVGLSNKAAEAYTTLANKHGEEILYEEIEVYRKAIIEYYKILNKYKVSSILDITGK